MNNILNNNKGIILITVYFVLVALLGLSAVAFIRSTNEARLAQRSADSLQAFYEAEAGIAYGYAEASRYGFEWYTHEDKTTQVSSTHSAIDSLGTKINFTCPVPTSVPGAAIDGTTHCYYVNNAQGNKRFEVKSYPEKDAADNYTGVIIILSQATVNGSTRTIEHRLGQKSAYQYFFFFPDTHIFDTATFDGRNFGGIHVDGDINLHGSPIFKYLTALTCAGPTDSTGYIRYPKKRDYPDLHGEIDYNSTVGDLTQLADYMYYYAQTQFYTGTTKFYTGSYPPPGEADSTPIDLHYYLSGNDADWKWDKYSGDGSDTTPAHYNISNDDLKNLATYEIAGHPGTITLLDNTHTITIDNPNIGTGTEKEIFKKLYNFPGVTVGQWNSFWEQWKVDHGEDYLAFHGTTLTGGADWERRFFRAAYNRADSNDDGIPDSYNKEWWENLSYGGDRFLLTNDLAEARVENYQTGKPLQDGNSNYLYFLNTEKQPTAWETWLSNNNLNQEGPNQTLVQDKTQLATYVAPGTILSEEEYATYNKFKDKALDGGIYIGSDQVFTGSTSGVFFNPIADCAEETQFYNARRPARSGSAYKPSKILVIDVHALKQKIDNGQLQDYYGNSISKDDFNGIVYVDLKGEGWASPYDSDADGVMLVNGERLPDNKGLSIVTPHNVFIKGNYNLDPLGCPDKNRDADAAEVIGRVIDNKDYIDYESDLAWQPAEVITRRAVYTLSEDFPEPQYMPMANDHNQQYYDERDYVLGQDFVSHPSYPTDGWVPTPSKDVSTKVNQWFTFYEDGQAVPSSWITKVGSKQWIDLNWPSNEVFPLDTTGPGGVPDGEPDTYILSNDLRNDVYNYIEKIYDSTFNYEIRHNGASSVGPPDETVSKFNSVTEKHIYNTAIVTPYDTSPYVLESWDWKYDTQNKKYVEVNTPRVINGAFIQLPYQAQYKDDIPPAARYSRVHAPVNTFNYETRFGRGAIAADRPATGLTFGADSSWREVDSANF